MRKATPAALISALLLSACGGGGSDGSPAPASVTLSGTVAAGEPLAGAQVTVFQENGTSAGTTTDSAGRYSVAVTVAPGSKRLFLIRAGSDTGTSLPPPYPRLFSIATASGTANVTPLTSLLVARLLGKRQDFSGDVAALRDLPIPAGATIATARQQVVSYLLQRPSKDNGNAIAPVDVSAVGDFIGSSFQAVSGDPYDDALERLGQSLMESESIQGVEEHMVSEDDPPADLTAILSFDLDATCQAEGPANPALPVGSVRIAATSSGSISIGRLTRVLAAGDRVRVTNGPFNDDRWIFTFAGTGDQIELGDRHGRVNSVVLILASGATSRCTPTAAPDLGPRNPSVLAQVRLLAQSITSPGFTCTVSPAFPGIQGGANTLAIQQNGALRVTTYALHLPSMGFALDADFVDTFAGVRPLVRGATATRIFRDGFDEFAVALSATGTIEGARFARRRGADDFAKTCGVI